MKNKIQRFDPLEAVKTFKGRYYGLYCTISGNEPSSVALFKPPTNARLLCSNVEISIFSLMKMITGARYDIGHFRFQKERNLNKNNHCSHLANTCFANF